MQSFPRKRESTPHAIGSRQSTNSIPAFAGMTGISKWIPFRMAPWPATGHGRRTTDVFPMHPIPTKIKLAAGNDTLSIHWSDGHAGAYSYRYLRDRCPCASCSEGGGTHRQPSNLLPMLGVKPLKPQRAELVGRYALQVFWNDGHSSGIYSFDYLRSLCPCPQCEISRQAARTPD